MATTFIYALCEPHSRTVRYIGKADRPKRRFREHLRSSVKFQSHLGCWLRSLISQGGQPTLVVLREVPVERWQIAEERFIRLARGCGMNLVNGSDGGDSGPYPTPETRDKIRIKNLGKVRSLESRAKQSLSTSGEKNHSFGRPKSAEVKEKIAAKLRGRRVDFSDSHCSSLSSATKTAWKRRLSTPEGRAADSVAKKAAWARRKAAKA